MDCHIASQPLALSSHYFRISDSVHDHLSKLFDYYLVVVDELAVADNFFDFSIAHSFSHGHHSMLEVAHSDFTVVIRVEDFKGLDEILQGLLILSTFADYLLDVLAVEIAALLRVHLCYHLLNFSLGRVDVEGADQISQLGSSDLTSLRLIKQIEDFLDLVRLKAARLHYKKSNY